MQALVAVQALPPRLLRELLQPQAPGPAAAAAAARPAAASGSTAAAAAATTLPAGLQEALRQRYNPSQLAAIEAAIDGFQPQVAAASRPAAGSAPATAAAAVAAPASTGGQPCFTLVQGPPGTGKTAAIIGMLSALLVQNTMASGGRGPRRGGAGTGAAAAAAAGDRKGGGGAQRGEEAPPLPAEVINPTVRWALFPCREAGQALRSHITLSAGPSPFPRGPAVLGPLLDPAAAWWGLSDPQDIPCFFVQPGDAYMPGRWCTRLPRHRRQQAQACKNRLCTPAPHAHRMLPMLAECSSCSPSAPAHPLLQGAGVRPVQRSSG